MDILDRYIFQKKKNTIVYAKIISEKINIMNNLWTNNQELNDILESVISDYYDDLYINNTVNNDLTKTIKEKVEKNETLKKILTYLLNYFLIKRNVKIEDTNKDDFLYIACVIHYSIKIDSRYDALSKKRDYVSYIDKIMHNLRRVEDFKVKRISKKYLLKFENRIKKNRKNYKEFFEIFKMDDFYNTYKLLSNNEYLVKYNYIIDKNKYRNSDVEKIFKEHKFDAQYSIMSLELLILFMLKTMNLKKNNLKFVIPLCENIYVSKKYMNKLNKLFKNNFKRMIKILVTKEEFNTNSNSIKLLLKNGFKITSFENIDTTFLNEEEKKLIYKSNESLEEYKSEKDTILKLNSRKESVL